MFGTRKSKALETQLAVQRRERNKSSRGDVQGSIAELRSVPREKLADAVFLLSMAAKQQSNQIRRSINERVGGEFEFEPPPRGDLADFLAAEAVSVLRHHEAGVPGLVDLLVQRSPDVGFTVDQRDAASMLASTMREQRLEGILEGLRLAGLLNESSKDRHAAFGS